MIQASVMPIRRVPLPSQSVYLVDPSPRPSV